MPVVGLLVLANFDKASLAVRRSFSFFFLFPSLYFYRADFSFAVSDSRSTLGFDLCCAGAGAVGRGGDLQRRTALNASQHSESISRTGKSTGYG